MLFDNDVKLKAQSALKRYLEGDYPDHVKNPILLLNYLYQHAIIPRPNYNTLTIVNDSEHAVSCKIGDAVMIGTGNTVKVARIRAAQLFLDHLLDTSYTNSTVNASVNVNTTQSFWSTDIPISSSFDSCNVNSDSFVQSANWIQPLNYDYPNENCISNGVSQSYLLNAMDHQPSIDVQCGSHKETNFNSNSYNTSLNLNFYKDRPHAASAKSIIVEPQCDINEIVPPLNYSTASPNQTKNEKIIQIDSSRDRSPENDANSQSSTDMSFENLHQMPLDFDNYFDPFFKQRPSNSNHKYIMETKNVINNVQQDEQKPLQKTSESFASNTKNEKIIQMEPSCDRSPENDANSQSSTDMSVENSHQMPTDFDNYFDPFFKQRSSNSNYKYIMETKNVINNVQQDEQKPVEKTDESSASNTNGKNVFAMLQKKTQKHLKRIPRFRFEDQENGFKCIVHLGPYVAQGEGRNKKEAKTNAAVCLLQQIEHLN